MAAAIARRVSSLLPSTISPASYRLKSHTSISSVHCINDKAQYCDRLLSEVAQPLIAVRFWSGKNHVFSSSRILHTTSWVRGLEEFFPKDGNSIEEAEKAGRSWSAKELRQKSNEDLHKLWYVLLKERNMLLTLRQEARRTGFIMPAPERVKKVRKSMARIKVVIQERETAIKEAKRILDKRSGTRKRSGVNSKARPHSDERLRTSTRIGTRLKRTRTGTTLKRTQIGTRSRPKRARS